MQEEDAGTGCIRWTRASRHRITDIIFSSLVFFMSSRLFMILVSLEGLFFISDIIIKTLVTRALLYYHSWFSISLYPNPRTIATQFPQSITMSVAVIVCLVCVYSIASARNPMQSLASGAIFFGVAGAIFDLLRYGVIIDWIRIGPLAFNGSDILIVGGIIGIFLEIQQRPQRVTK